MKIERVYAVVRPFPTANKILYKIFALFDNPEAALELKAELQHDYSDVDVILYDVKHAYVPCEEN